MKKNSRLPLFFAIHFFISNAEANSQISEKIINAFFSSPISLMNQISTTNDLKINLLKWNENPQDPPVPSERYNRLFHFGQWITLNQNPEDCVDVRNRILIRESQIPVEMRPANPCKVGTGRWHDPYSDKIFEKSEDVQIDHFVPLKDTYTNGGWKWDYQTRCVYANYMGYRNHLKPIHSYENSLKSDRSPDGYMPPNSLYKCEYLKSWLSIKLIWRLGMQRAEALAIKQLVAQENCNPAEFKFSVEELQNQRLSIQNMLPICPENSPFEKGSDKGQDPSEIK